MQEYRKNTILTMEIEDLGTDGEGIGHVEGFTFFVKDALPGDVIDFGRSDNIGFARGNLLDDGELYLVGASSGTSISRIKFSDGELDTDNTYLASCDGVGANSGTVLNYYTDLNGNDAILYINRSSTPKKLAFEGDNFVATEFSLPNKGNCNGAFPFIWDGKELVVYPTPTNYFDGFAVAEMNASALIVQVQETVNANANTYQANWLNAEVIDSRNVTIYQYYPGGHLTVWRLAKRGGVLRGDANDDGNVTIVDVTVLIDYLLTESTDGINLYNADCSQDGNISISDITVLIDYLLSNTWPE